MHLSILTLILPKNSNLCYKPPAISEGVESKGDTPSIEKGIVINVMDNLLEPSQEFFSFSPFPTGPNPHSNVSRQLAADDLSRPRISTIMRRWALQHEDVRKVVLYHTGVRYSVAVLIEEPTVERIREFNRDLIALLEDLFPPVVAPSTYVVGSEFSDTPMFHRFGAITVIDKADEAYMRCAA